jgi:hypothetical protein
LMGSKQAVHTCLGKLSYRGFFVKEGLGKKLIYLDPALKIQTEGTVICSTKIIKKRETDKPTGTVQKNSRAVATT